MKRVLSYCTAILSIAVSTPGFAACPASNESNVQLEILGSGGPDTPGRASTSYVLWVEGISRVLVDAGGGTSDQFRRSGANFDDIQLVAISHLHPDHSVELPALLWPEGGSLRVAGPSAAGIFPSIDGFLDRLFGPGGAFYVLAEELALETITVDVTGGPTEIWQGEDVVVQGIGVPHGDVPTLGYRVEVADSSIAFASDQNGSDPSFIDFISGADVLVIHLGGSEASTGEIAELHARPSVWGRMATSADVGQVVVSHIGTSSSDELNASLAFLRENYSGPITVGEDSLCIEVR